MTNDSCPSNIVPETVSIFCRSIRLICMSIFCKVFTHLLRCSSSWYVVEFFIPPLPKIRIFDWTFSKYRRNDDVSRWDGRAMTLSRLVPSYLKCLSSAPSLLMMSSRYTICATSLGYSSLYRIRNFSNSVYSSPSYLGGVKTYLLSSFK